MDLAIEFDIGKVKHRTRNASHEKGKHFSLALEFDKLQTVCVGVPMCKIEKDNLSPKRTKLLANLFNRKKKV